MLGAERGTTRGEDWNSEENVTTPGKADLFRHGSETLLHYEHGDTAARLAPDIWHPWANGKIQAQRARRLFSPLTLPLRPENLAAQQPPMSEWHLNNKPRFCDWPKQARCKAREVQVYAHTPNLPQRSRLPVFDNPEGFEDWLLFYSDVAFTFRCKRWATALHFKFFVRSTIQIPANSQTQNLG